jgi:hypothetical protein
MVKDFKSAFISIEDRLRIEPLVDNSWVIHRKVLPVSKPQKQTFILFVKGDSFKQVVEEIKVILTE